MTFWIIRGVWIAGALLCWRSCVWRLTSWGVRPGRPLDGQDLFFGLFWGTIMAAAAWPVYLLVIATRAVFRGHSAGIIALLTPRRVRREQDLAAREKRIRELERKLGLPR